LPSDYYTGTADRTQFDARCTRFLCVNYDDLRQRVFEGGTDEEILGWCFERGYRPREDEIEIWNEFMRKRGWRDSGSAELDEAKRNAGFENRPDIHTWFELHVAEES
jgi:gluconokinase